MDIIVLYKAFIYKVNIAKVNDKIIITLLI